MSSPDADPKYTGIVSWRILQEPVGPLLVRCRSGRPAVLCRATGNTCLALILAMAFIWTPVRSLFAADPPALHHEFYFSRGVYQSVADGDAWGPRWAIDFPEADEHFLVALKRMTTVDAFPGSHVVPVGEEGLKEYPFIYLVEAGALDLNLLQAERLRKYLLSGGFLIIDDFWGTWAWENLSVQLKVLFPQRSVQDLSLDHPVFHSFYDIDALVQVPNVALANGPKTYEYDGKTPHARGIVDDQNRLMVLINWNTDLGDAWEWADDPGYPLRYSNYAYKLGVNAVIYALSY